MERERRQIRPHAHVAVRQRRAGSVLGLGHGGLAQHEQHNESQSEIERSQPECEPEVAP